MSHHELTPYENLLQDCQTLSLEAFSLNDIKKAIDNTVPRLSASFMDTFRLMTRWDFSRPEVLNVSALRMKARRLDYLEMDDVLVPVPTGFQGNMVDYTVHLQQRIIPALESVIPTIETAIDFLSAYINEPETFQERVLDGADIPPRSQIDTLLKSEAEFYQMGNRVSDQAYTHVFENNASMISAVEGVNALNVKRWQTASPKRLSEKVKALGQIATVLFKSVQEMEEPPHKDQLRLIADTLELTARWVEWYSVTTTRIIELTAAMKRMEQKFLRL